MRLFWLALSIVFPLILVEAVDYYSPATLMLRVSYSVGCLAEIVFIALSVSEFVRYHKKQEYLTHQKIRHDRDEDIKKWRKEFMRDSLDLYEIQNESLKRAEGLAGRSETHAPSFSDRANTRTNPSE